MDKIIEEKKINFVIFLILEMLLLEIFDRDGKRVIMTVYFGLNLDLFREGVEVEIEYFILICNWKRLNYDFGYWLVKMRDMLILVFFYLKILFLCLLRIFKKCLFLN